MKKQLTGFIEFIRSKGVVGLAIGVIIGVAINAVVNSLVNDIINPLIAAITGGSQLKEAVWTLGEATIKWGSFVSALLNLFVIAAVVYFGFKGLGLEKLDLKKEDK